MANIIRAVGNYLNPLELGVELGAGALVAAASYATCCSSHDWLNNMAVGVGMVGGFCFGRSHRDEIYYNNYDSTRKDRLIRGAVRSLVYVGALTAVDMLTRESTTIKHALPIWSDSWRYGLGLLGGSFVGINTQITHHSEQKPKYVILDMGESVVHPRKKVISTVSIPESREKVY